MKDWTPEAMRCPMGDCPSIYELEDGRLLIVGERALGGDASMILLQIAKVLDTVGTHETAVIIERRLLAKLFEMKDAP